MKIVVPEDGDHISAIRVVEGQRKAEREIDPLSLEGGQRNNNGHDQADPEELNPYEDEQPEAALATDSDPPDIDLIDR